MLFGSVLVSGLGFPPLVLAIVNDVAFALPFAAGVSLNLHRSAI